LQVRSGSFIVSACDDKVSDPWQVLQDRKGRRSEHDCLLTGLGIRQKQQPARQINMIPSQIEYLAQTGAREDQQAQCGRGMGTNIGDAILALSRML